MKLTLTILLGFACLTITAQCPRALAVNDYLSNYKPNQFNLKELAFNGDIEACQTGSYASIINQKMLNRVNYLRRLVGVSDDIIFDNALNKDCLEAAVMQEANRIISHCYGENDAPCNTWLCASPRAIKISQGALLTFANWNYFDPIEMYTHDGGALNTAVSHRRWLLYSKAKIFGNGVTENRNVLYVHGNSNNPSTNKKDFIAYPTEGYMPAPLVFPRWSFTIPNAYFGKANVQMVDENGKAVDLTIIHKVGGSPEPAIVWEPKNISLNKPFDVNYTITVSNIEEAPQSSYTYKTTIVQAIHPPACAADKSWSTVACACIKTNICTDTLALNVKPLVNGLYAANMILTAEGTLKANSTLEFNAGNEVHLLKDFEVKLGAELVVNLEGCD